MASTHMAAAAAALLVLLLNVARAAPVSYNHGVASGDPTESSIIIWTRVEPRNPYPINDTYTVNWVVSRTKDLAAVVASGAITTNADRDFTVKADVGDLEAGMLYYYGFYTEGSENVAGSPVAYKVSSPIGKFKLPYPQGSDKQKKLRYAVLSCSNWGWGYFNVYDVASRYDLDFWVHLGDYLYEYGLMSYPSPQQAVRFQNPEVGGISMDEMVTLDQYRKRHALYRQDAGLQVLSARAPLLSIWDDHETTNNARMTTAQNHQSVTEGDYEQRKENARRSYYEWMPIREIEDGNFIGLKLNKTLSFGNLAKVYLMEERLTGRTDEPVTMDSSDESTFRYPGPSVSARITAIVANKNSTDYTPEEVTALNEIRAFAESIRDNENATLAGPEQLKWVEEETMMANDAGVTWDLYMHGTPMLERFSDYEAAIAQMMEKDPKRAAVWEQRFRAIVYGEGEQTTKSYGIQCFNRPYLGKALNISESMRSSVRNQQAAGKFKIQTGYDTWAGFNKERKAFLEIAKQAKNAVQYGGDSHADWAGMMKIDGEPILAEFSVGSVTSPSSESGAYLPLDFINAAIVAGSYDTNNSGLRYAGVGNKGFLLVELDAKVHHAEYIHVDNWCTPHYQASCDYAYDYYTAEERAKRNMDNDFGKGKCKAVPQGKPYQFVQYVNTKFGQQASFVP